MVKFFRFLREDQNMSITAIYGYRSALNQIFTLGGNDLLECKVLTNILKSYRKSCSPKDHLVPEWDGLLVLKKLSGSPFEPLEKASFRDLSLKTVLALRAPFFAPGTLRYSLK